MIAEWKALLRRQSNEWGISGVDDWTFLVHNNYHQNTSGLNVFWFHRARDPLVVMKAYKEPDMPRREFRNLEAAHASAGLRLAEIVGLKLGDLDLNADCIEVLDTKFFKSRRLPLSATAMAALRDYLKARAKAGAPIESDAPLFWHAKGGYGYVATGAHLRRLIRVAGLKSAGGRTGPRVHDLRHAFVVHRMTKWYEQGINPQTRLPYLAAYLGHRDIHSTLVYLTITQELLQHANERFRTSEAEVLQVIQRCR
jgi:integrase/recombinase XerD